MEGRRRGLEPGEDSICNGADVNTGHVDSSAFIVRFADEAVADNQYNSCEGYSWQDLRKHYKPGAYQDGE